MSSSEEDDPIVEKEQYEEYEGELMEYEEFPDASDVFGEDVEVLVEGNDELELREGVLKRHEDKVLEFYQDADMKYSLEYLKHSMSMVKFIRNICFVGHLHHGKTTFLDQLIRETHESEPERFTDHRMDEQERKISVKMSPMSLLLPNLHSKSYLFNIIDCPGHVNFLEEVSCAMSLSDGVCLFVDVLEGPMLVTEKSLELAAQFNLPVTLVLSKIDRLIFEVHMSPRDAYLKILSTLKDVNIIANQLQLKKFNPRDNNVTFSMLGMSFTLLQFSRYYSDYYKNFNPIDFARRLWGPIAFDHETRKFTQIPTSSLFSQDCSFVTFILNPLYKLCAHTVGKETKDLKTFLKKGGIKRAKMGSNLSERVYNVLEKFFQNSCGFVQMVTDCLDDPEMGRVRILEQSQLTEVINVEASDLSELPLIISVGKNFHLQNNMMSFGRIIQGKLVRNTPVNIISGDSYATANIESFDLSCTRYRIPLETAYPGNFVMLDKVHDHIFKTGTLLDKSIPAMFDICLFKYPTISVFQVCIEPILPSKLPIMIQGLRSISKQFPLFDHKVEESGSYIISGTGEMHLEVILHDLRQQTGIELKVSEPFVRFCESVSETSGMECIIQSPNEQNRMSVIAEPLEPRIVADIELGILNFEGENLKSRYRKMKNYGWDLATTKSLWGFGPQENSPNIIFNEVFDNPAMDEVKDNVIQGFKWATMEGPLCNANVREVKFRILEAELADDPVDRTSGEIIPMIRKVLYAAFLTASPRLMEPIYRVQIQTPLECMKQIESVIIGRRRGHVVNTFPIPGSPFSIMECKVPVIDTFGLETDIRTVTQGLAFSLSVFDGWRMVPGDPLDTRIQLQPLESAPIQYLGRDFLLKTRRRKGFPDDLGIARYFDDPAQLNDIFEY